MQLRIMVLDASPTSRKILEVILRRAGHQVASFDDPLEARRFFARLGPADLLFLSLDLPGRDGLTVLKYVKREAGLRSMAPIALLQQDDGVLARIMARLAGAERVVSKPLVRRQVLALVAEYQDRGTSTRAAARRANSDGESSAAERG